MRGKGIYRALIILPWAVPQIIALYQAASSILISIPVVVIFLYSSKWLVSGITSGGVKG
ncbi:MAG TPA: hypothetical protein VLM76_07995 [Patescibacteria group bacterium]|nr:hypothetical protein [Patescibacteria group bacterium]